MKRILCVAAALTLLACGERKQEPKADSETAKPDAKGHPEKYIEEANVVELSQEAQRRAGIQVAPLASGSVEARVILTGTVQPIDNKVAQVRALARGRITQVSVKVGDRVQKDQVLALFDNIEAGELASQYSSALAELERLKIQQANAQRQTDRSRDLLQVGAIPAKDAESAEATSRGAAQLVRSQDAVLAGLSARLKRFGVQGEGGVDASATSIRAPFAGVVTKSDVAPGAVVDSSTPLLSIADLSRVYVEAQVYEKDLGRIHVGQVTHVRFEAYPNDSLPGRVVAIRDILDVQTRTAGVRIELANPEGKLRLEMFATIELPTVGTHTALTVPSEAVQTINQRQVLFVKQDALHFAAREVKTAGEGLMREVISGAKEGEAVVVGGAYQLKSVFLSRQVQGEHDH